MTTFFLIRHAERDTVADLLPGRAPGIRLTERGRAQAEAIARRLAGETLQQIWSSPLERAIDTASPLARAQRLVVESNAAFHEMDFGEWTGRRMGELERVAAWRCFNQFRSGTRIPGGETAGEVQGRFVSELLRLAAAQPDARIACVSHADPIRLALAYFLGMPIDLAERIEVGIASISVLTIADWGARVLRVNDVVDA